MNIKLDLKDSTAIVSLEEKILGTPADSKIFEAKMNELIEQSVTKVVLNLENVKRINSTGLAILITGFNILSNHNGTFILANPNEFIKGALAITKLNNVFETYDDLTAAINS